MSAISKTGLERNKDLAGKKVYAHGMNITYDEQGYVKFAFNPSAPNYKGTTKSIKWQPVEDALAGLPWEEPSHEGLIEWGDGTGMPPVEQ